MIGVSRVGAQSAEGWEGDHVAKAKFKRGITYSLIASIVRGYACAHLTASSNRSSRFWAEFRVIKSLLSSLAPEKPLT